MILNKIIPVFCAVLLSSLVTVGNEHAIDYESFLSQHDLVWEQAPKAWYDGPFLGNGMLGSMFYQLNDHQIRISLGRSDMEDHRTDGNSFISQSRLPNGYFTLNTVGKITGFKGRLDLNNAEARATITTDQGTIELTGLVHSEDMVIAYTCIPSSGEAKVQFEWHPLDAISPARRQADDEVAAHGDKANKARIKWHKANYEYNPKPVVSKQGGYDVCRQTLLAGGESGTAWKIKVGTDGAKILYISIEHSFPETTAVDDAIAHLESIESESYNQFVERHRVWWHAYYPQSFLSIDDTRMESFYWIQVYKFGAGARQGRAYMDTMGPWMVESTAWANGWFNLNTQLSYWFLLTANRMEVAESLFTKMDECLPTFVANMPDKYKGECAGISTIAPQTFISKFPNGRLGFMGDLLWACHDYWMMLERTMDEDRIKEHFFPLLKKAVNTYVYNMVEGDDGKIHLPETRSPEYGGGEDCNFNLALFRWGAQTLVTISERYGIDDPQLPQWKDIVARLVDYPVNENGFMVAKDFPFEQSHRHYSHLLMIYPLLEINMDQEENRELIKKSVSHWINYPGTGNAGYSWSGVAAMYALQGDGEKAAEYLDIFLKMDELFPKNPAQIHPTTMYTETGFKQPVTETPFSLCDSLQQMLLQSWNGKIRVFPAMPADWKNASFEGFLAVGGFEVSASRKGGKTQFVQIRSRAGEPCLLTTDLQEPIRVEGIAASAVKKLSAGTLEIKLNAGDEVVLFADGVSGPAVIEPVAADHELVNSFGVK